MGNFLKWFSDIADAITGKLNLSGEAQIAVAIGLVLIGIVAAIFVYKLIKRKIGKVVAIVVLIAILVTTGFFSLANFANFAEKIGMIEKSSIGEGMEVNGDAFIEWIQGTAPGEESGAGSWVPNRNEQTAGDWSKK